MEWNTQRNCVKKPKQFQAKQHPRTTVSKRTQAMLGETVAFSENLLLSPAYFWQRDSESGLGPGVFGVLWDIWIEG